MASVTDRPASLRDYRPLADLMAELGYHLSAGIRWATKGVKLSDGTRKYLDAKKTPGRWVVTDQAMREFLDALTRDRQGVTADVPSQPSVTLAPARLRAAERADRELQAAGF